MKKSEYITCPGLFHNTSALDGIIYRIRTPGGIINSNQCRAIAKLAKKISDGDIQITNRANLQIRAIDDNISSEILENLQTIALAAQISDVDRLRNIMSSPTAGIDRTQLIDTRPIVKELDKYISSHPHLAELPSKFSVGFDGGETVSIALFHNEILFAAVRENSKVYFRLYLSVEKDKLPVDTGVLIRVEECLSVAIALMEAYLEGVHLLSKSNLENSKKPRLRQILKQWGIDWYLDRVSKYLSFPLRRQSHQSETVQQNAKFQDGHLGIHPQGQENLSYVGLVVPLGRLFVKQLEELAHLVEVYGNGTLRLTPWQNLLIPDVPNATILNLQLEIEKLGWHYSPTHPSSGIVACTGNTGCKSSATDTKNHALRLVKYLEENVLLDRPINIHFTGCLKSCAQNIIGDITLLGTTIEKGKQTVEGYHVYVGNSDGEEKFGQLLYRNVIFDDLPTLIAQILQTERKTLNSQYLTIDRNDTRIYP